MSFVSIFLGLGSNLGDRAENLRRALHALPPKVFLSAVSPCYETEPAYVANQPHFYNIVCRALTELEPLPLLRYLKHLEQDLGRVASERYGPRVIDIDILFYGGLVYTSPELTIPHPRIAERTFVLVPLADLAPSFLHPTHSKNIHDLRDQLINWRALQHVPFEWLDEKPPTFKVD